MVKRFFALLLCAVFIVAFPVFTLSAAAIGCDVVADVGDREVQFSTFNVDGKYVVRIRDFADLLDGTDFLFDVGWEPELKQVMLIKGQPYTPTEDATFLKFENKFYEYEGEDIKILAGGTTTPMQGYIIDGHNYVAIEDIAGLLGLMVEYDEGTISFKAGLSRADLIMTMTFGDLPESTPERVVDKDKPMLALTFDDGPRSESTEKILAALDGVGGCATFFVTGSRVEKNAELVKKIVEQGSQVGNHTYSHSKITELSVEQIKREVNLTSNAVYAASGVYPMIGRPPYGAINDNVREATSIPWFNWSIDTEDWKYKDTDYVYNYVINNAKNGAVVLLHDLQPTTAEAMVKAIPKLSEMGYQLVTIDELAEVKGGYENVPGYLK